MRKCCVVFLVLVLLQNNANSQPFSLVKDIRPGVNSSTPASLTAIHNKLFFQADDGINGVECWVSDGTEAGTNIFKDINPGAASSNATAFTRLGNTIYFIADDGAHGSELWNSDGTATGTFMVKDINPGAGSSAIASLVILNNQLYFIANDGAHGFELWKTDGTDAGTAMIKDINTAAAGGFPGNHSYPSELTIMDDRLYFSAVDATGNFGLWTTDGTSSGTTLLKNMEISSIRNINDRLFIAAGNNLWLSDGTTTGTQSIKNTGPVNSLTVLDGNAFFYTVSAGNTIILWKSDGTTAGTVQVKQLPTSASFFIGYFLTNGNTLFFVAPHPTGGTELWKTDGTTDGTVMVKDIYQGASGSEPSSLTNISSDIYFSATNGASGKEIWKTDGTEEGTVMVQDISYPGSSQPAFFTQVGFKIFVVATNNENGRELWVANVSGPVGGLPLTMVGFTGRLAEHDAKLQWQTLAEHNTSHFEIERSLTSHNFRATARLTAAGNSTISKNYAFIDKNIDQLGSSIVYYRLKMLDLDGRYTYSKIIAVNIDHPAVSIKLFPNPVTDKSLLVVTSLKKESLQICIFDQQGKRLQNQTVNIVEGNQNVPIQTSTLTTGVYTVVIQGSNTRQEIRFIK